MSLSETLWRENEDLASAALEGNFVSGLADGDLPIESFRHYVAQDAFFLKSFARAYALALVKVPDSEGMNAFSSLITGALEELGLHTAYAERWSVDLTDVAPTDATLTYTEFLLSTASLGKIEEICAAMTPCMRLYAYLGQTLAGRSSNKGNDYEEWIETYAAPGFEELAARLERLLDGYAEDTTAVKSAYRRAMRLEVRFFEEGAKQA